MKKLSLFIITYNNDEALNKSLDSLFSSDANSAVDLSVNIINNYSSINVDKSFQKQVRIINNECRADFFNPNLSQNHNQAIIHGFESLVSPKSDIVVHTHNDICFNKNWTSNLLNCLCDFNFVAGSIGDQFMAYTPEAIKKIGLWDENFPGLVHKECDYFLRAFLFNKEFSYINDSSHGRLLNSSVKFVFDDVVRYPKNQALKSAISHRKITGKTNWELSYEYFKLKWKGTSNLPCDRSWLTHWDEINLLENIIHPPLDVMQFMKYPFFESDVETLKEQNFLV